MAASETKCCNRCGEIRDMEYFTVVKKKEKGNSALNNKCHFPFTNPTGDSLNETCYTKETSAIAERLTGSVDQLSEVFIILNHCCCNIYRPQHWCSGSTWKVAENEHAVSGEETS